METFHMKDICSDCPSPVFPRRTGASEGGRPLTLCTHWHQPPTEAVKQTSKHAPHTPFSHIPSQSPLCCPHNGNPNTQERFFHANVKSIQGKGKYAIRDSSCAQRKQYAVKCLRRRPRQPPAFQLCCQQYINMTNTRGCDLSIRAEPNLTSELWSVWVDKHNCNSLEKKKKKKGVRSGSSSSEIEKNKFFFFNFLLLFFF